MKRLFDNSAESKGAIKGFIFAPTLRLPFFLLMTAAAFVGGFMRNNAALYTVAAFFALLFLLSALYSAVLCVGISGVFAYEKESVAKGESNAAVLKITNSSFLPVFLGKARVSAPNPEEDYNPCDTVNVGFSCSPFSSADCRCEVVFAYSGKFSAYLESVSVSDPLGLFCCRYKRGAAAETVVMPRGDNGVNSALIAYHDGQNIKNVQNIQNGSDEFLDLRGYTAGDLLRDIHWKLSAKSNELVVIRRASEERSMCALVCDSGAYYGERSELSESDEVFETTAALLRAGYVGNIKLIWNGGSCTVGDDNGADALEKAIRAPRHEAGSFKISLDGEFTDCAGLVIVTARITEDIMGFAADFRTSSGFRIPVDIILCGSLQNELPEKRLAALNIGLIRRKGGNI